MAKQFIPDYLSLDFEESDFSGNNISIYRFKLSSSIGFLFLRGKCWEFVSLLKPEEEFWFLEKFLQNYPEENDRGIITADTAAIEQILNRLPMDFSFQKEVFISALNERFKSLGVSIKTSPIEDPIDLSMVGFLVKKHDRGKDFKIEEEERLDEIGKFAFKFDCSRLNAVLEDCNKFSEINHQSNDWLAARFVCDFIHEMNDPIRFENAFSGFITFGKFSFQIEPQDIIKKSQAILGKAKTIGAIERCQIPELKNVMMFDYFCTLPENEIADADYSGLVEFLSCKDDRFITSSRFRGTDFIKKFSHCKGYSYLENVKVLFSKREYNPTICRIYLELLFDDLEDKPDEVLRDFVQNKCLLGSIYSFLERQNASFDPEGKFFAVLSQIDPQFFDSEVVAMVKDGFASPFAPAEKLGALWNLSEYNTLFDKVFGALSEKKVSFFFAEHLLEHLFGQQRRKSEVETARQNEWVERTIQRFCGDADKMVLLFSGVANMQEEERISHISCFLQLNSSIDLFKDISLFPSVVSWSGSEVPVIEGKIKFLNSLNAKIPNSTNFIEHHAFLRQEIDILRKNRDEVEINEMAGDRLFQMM